MVGYGDESDHFVMELTYNYGVTKYEMGNDLDGIVIRNGALWNRIREKNYPFEKMIDGRVLVKSPDGYRFYIVLLPSTERDPVQSVFLHSSNLDNSIRFWSEILKLKVCDEAQAAELFQTKHTEALSDFSVHFVPTATVNRAKAYGRIAFSVAREDQSMIEAAVKNSALGKILTPIIELDTPGKASVFVLIVADSDGHEICFVEDERYRLLSQTEEGCEKILFALMQKDPFQE